MHNHRIYHIPRNIYTNLQVCKLSVSSLRFIVPEFFFYDGLINALSSYCSNPVRPRLVFLIREFLVDYSNINENHHFNIHITLYGKMLFLFPLYSQEGNCHKCRSFITYLWRWESTSFPAVTFPESKFKFPNMRNLFSSDQSGCKSFSWLTAKNPYMQVCYCK